MRKSEQKNLLNLNDILIDAIQQLDTYIQVQQYATANELLMTCQQGALSIGTFLEQAEENSHEVINELEAYCDNLYQISMNLGNESYQFDSILKAITTQLKSVENHLKHNVHVQYEIVFLPYKASMWDSMESVWRAAKEDPNCVCYVVPIPYFEAVNGATPEMKYEGSEMPKDVPVTSYREYSIKDRKPDVIYIHNPTDNLNMVTSVHPAFYTLELKKHTDMLVYIPYYIVGNSLHEAFKYMPSYHNMDRIIVQSEQIKAEYDSSIPKEKIVALGSPKIDKLITYQNNINDLPKEWRAIIQNKKVVFFNTSLSSLYEYKEKVLNKIEHIFSIFKNRTDVALLWRPHPLIKATLKSMMPELYPRFCKLEEEYVIEEIGILDTSSEVSRAVVISDAYIGEEGSSIIHMFNILDKPIFLLDKLEYMPSSIKQNIVGSLDAYVDGEYLWFIHSNYNALCRMNIETGKTENISLVPNEIFNSERLYQDVIKVDDVLYFAPQRAKEIAKFNISTKSLEKVQFAAGEYFSRFTRMLRYKDDLYLLPTYYPSLIKLNIEDHSVKYYPEVIRKLKKLLPQESRNEAQFYNAMCVEDHYLLMASAQSNIIIEFNMITENAKFHRVGHITNTYYHMEFDGKDYWLIPHESKSIVRWNRKTNKIKEYSRYPEGFNGGKYAFLNIINCGEYVLAFPKKANMIIKIDLNSDQITEYKLHLPYREGERKADYYDWPNQYYFVKKLDDTRLIALTAYDCSLLIIDLNTQSFELIKGVLEPSVQFGSYSKNNPDIYREETTLIEDFLKEMQLISHSRKQIQAYSEVDNKLNGTSGKKIHDYIMKECSSC